MGIGSSLINAGASVIGTQIDSKTSKRNRQAQIDISDANREAMLNNAAANRQNSLKLAGLNLAGGFKSQLAIQQNAQEFQEHLASTNYQRSVADMKAAGLNPAMAAGGSGVSTPTATTSNSSNGSNGLSGALLKALIMSSANKAIRSNHGSKNSSFNR